MGALVIAVFQIEFKTRLSLVSLALKESEGEAKIDSDHSPTRIAYRVRICRREIA
jgi:hypothetical protein